MQKFIRVVSIGIVVILLIGGIFFLASFIESSESAQSLVENFGVSGIFILALIGGFNLFIPIHAAAFTPIFVAAGFSLPIIIATLAIGTAIADILSYIFGYWGKTTVATKWPNVHQKIYTFAGTHERWIIPLVFLYSAFVPLPNEIMLVPLGLIGFKLSKIIPPLLLGTLLNVTIFTLGFVSIFELLF